jgi:hypothetical protein
VNWIALAVGLILLANGAGNLISRQRREANVQKMVDRGSPLFRALRLGPPTESSARIYTLALGSLMVALGLGFAVAAALDF